MAVREDVPTVPARPSAITSIGDLQARVGTAGTNPSAPALQTGGLNTSKYPNLAAFHLSEDLVNLPIMFSYGSAPHLYFPGRGMGSDEAPHTSQMIGGRDPKTVNMIDALQQFSSMSGDPLTMLQSALVNRGFIKQRGWGNFGDPDETSLKGWQTALERASRSNKTIWEVLSGGKAKSSEDFFKGGQDQYNKAIAKLSASARGGGGRGRAALQIRYSNPDDLKAVARGAAQDTLGYVPNDDFLDDFVRLYHGLEGGAQKKAYGGGNFTEPGSAEVQAGKLAKTEHKTEAEGYAIVKQFDSLLKILGAGGE